MDHNWCKCRNMLSYNQDNFHFAGSPRVKTSQKVNWEGLLFDSHCTCMCVACKVIRHHQRRRLRSVDTTTMRMPSTRRSALGDRAFPEAAAPAWNSLPPQTTAASSPPTFRRETKSHLSVSHFPDRIWRCSC